MLLVAPSCATGELGIFNNTRDMMLVSSPTAGQFCPSLRSLISGQGMRLIGNVRFVMGPCPICHDESNEPARWPTLLNVNFALKVKPR